MAMSGGVDSSVAAALLVQQGYHVVGAYMKNWILDVPGMQCPWAEDLAYAKRTAVRLGIDFRVYDYQEAYKRDVVDYLVAEYRAGRTPNPDVMCNQQVKFGAFLDDALADGFDYVATGHYARVGNAPEDTAPEDTVPEGNASESNGESPPVFSLLRAADAHKDQTYFLYRLGQHALAHTLFPLGDYTKDEVRALAAQLGLPAAAKPDSQGICFIGEASIQDFLRQYVSPQPGAIVDADTNQVVGAHEGALFFTLGQRKGLRIGGTEPYLVVGKDMDANVIYVAHAGTHAAEEGLQADGVSLQDCSWVAQAAGQSGTPLPGTCLVRTRHTGPLVEAHLEYEDAAGDGQGPAVRIRFAQAGERVAPGQSVVVYRGQECLGGGIAC